jgi:streptogramin lyase
MPITHSLFRLVIPLLLATAASAASSRIQTLAGTGAKGYSGDNGPADAAKLNDPCGLVVGPDEALYVCDTANHAIRRIAPDQTITTFVGTGKPGYSGDGGPAIKATLNEPYEVRFDKSGNLFVVERINHCVRRVDHKTGVITTVAGTGKAGFSGDNGPANKAELRDPHSIQFGPDGSLYIADVLNHRIRRVDMTSGVISTFAGTGEKKSPTDGGRLEGSPLHGPRALDFGPDGNLYVALREGNSVWCIVMKAGTLHHLAGTGKKGFAGNDGPAKSATLSGPKGIAVARDGAVYIADTESHSIRYIDASKGTIHVLAGTGEKGDGPDGAAAACKLNRPHGVFVAGNGAVLIGDSGNHRVRGVKVARD